MRMGQTELRNSRVCIILTEIHQAKNRQKKDEAQGLVQNILNYSSSLSA